MPSSTGVGPAFEEHWKRKGRGAPAKRVYFGPCVSVTTTPTSVTFRRGKRPSRKTPAQARAMSHSFIPGANNTEPQSTTAGGRRTRNSFLLPQLQQLESEDAHTRVVARKEAQLTLARRSWLTLGCHKGARQSLSCARLLNYMARTRQAHKSDNVTVRRR